MAFDPMAAAIDWLDAYRAGDIEAILNMYGDGAVTECRCDGVVITGAEGLRAYWERRLQQYPASELDDLRPSPNGAEINYVARNGVVAAILEFNSLGQIICLRCGPRRKPESGIAHATEEYAGDQRRLIEMLRRKLN